MKKLSLGILKWTGLAVIVLAVLYGVARIASSMSLQRAYAALQADGRPMKAEDVVPSAIPEADNAALGYQAAVLLLKSERAGGRNMFEHLAELAEKTDASAPDGEAAAQMRRLLRNETVSTAVAILAAASAKPDCRYDIDYAKGVALELPHLYDLRNLSRILRAKARLQAVDGEPAAAWDTLIVCLRLADAPRTEPILISQLVRCGQVRAAAEAMAFIASIAPPADGQYNELMDLLAGCEDIAPLVKAFDGERLLLGEWVFNRMSWRELPALADAEGRSPGAFLAFSYYLSTPWVVRDHAEYLKIMHAYARAATAPYSTDDAGLGERLLGGLPRFCFFTRRLLAPDLSAVKGRYLSMTAAARVARAGLAVLRRRHSDGVYPAELPATDAGGLVDPFTNRPLVYKAEPSGFVVYSVGANLVDDNGLKSDRHDSGDIIWRYAEVP